MAPSLYWLMLIFIKRYFSKRQSEEIHRESYGTLTNVWLMDASSPIFLKKWSHLHKVAAASPLSLFCREDPFSFQHTTLALSLVVPLIQLIRWGHSPLRSVWWSWNWVLQIIWHVSKKSLIWSQRGRSQLRSLRTFKKTSLQSGFDSCCSLRWETIGAEPASPEQQGFLLYSKMFISFHGGLWNAGSRNPALNVPQGTLGY